MAAGLDAAVGKPNCREGWQQLTELGDTKVSPALTTVSITKAVYGESIGWPDGNAVTQRAQGKASIVVTSPLQFPRAEMSCCQIRNASAGRCRLSGKPPPVNAESSVARRLICWGLMSAATTQPLPPAQSPGSSLG